MKISKLLVDQYMAIVFNFPPTSSLLHTLQVENCDINSRLVVDEDDNGKLRLESVKGQDKLCFYSFEAEDNNLNLHLVHITGNFVLYSTSFYFFYIK